MLEKFKLQVSQVKISNMIKRLLEDLSSNIKKDDVKQHRTIKFFEQEKILCEYFNQYQNRVNMTKKTNHREGKWVFGKDIPYSYTRISQSWLVFQIKTWHQDISLFKTKWISWYGDREEKFTVYKSESILIFHERCFQYGWRKIVIYNTTW